MRSPWDTDGSLLTPLQAVCSLTATLLTEVGKYVRVEPDLQELTGEVMSRHTAITTEGARLDIAANGFWGGRFKRTFFDIHVRVFNPYAPSNWQSSFEKYYRKHELKEGSHNLLQETSIPPCWEVGSALQLHNELAEM